MWWSTLFSSNAAASGHRPLIPCDLKLAAGGGGHYTIHSFMHPVEISGTVGVDMSKKLYLSSLCYSGLL